MTDLVAPPGALLPEKRRRSVVGFPVCPLRDFGDWPNLRRNFWSNARPNLEVSAGFRGFPDVYCKIPGRNRASALFVAMHHAAELGQTSNFRNDQN